MPCAAAERVVESREREPGRPGAAARPALPTSFGVRRFLPVALLVTFATVVVPLLLLGPLQTLIGVRTIPLSVGLAIGLSGLIAAVGAAVWQRLPSSRDILFGDLVLFGYLRRATAERRLAGAARLLGAEPFDAGSTGPGRARQVQILERLATALDARDPFMLGHSRRVARSAQMVASRMGLPAEQVRKVRIAAAVHDAGKINTPREILNKPGPLTDEEFEVVKRHPGDGADLLEPFGDPEIVAIVRHHHERLDGSGYPHGLWGHDIPVGARIIAVADTFDAITSSRPYRPRRTQHAAIRILKEESGTRLDAQAVGAFMSCYAGRRVTALSSFLVAAPERFLAWLTGSAGPLSQGAAATAAVVGLGGAFVGPPVQSDATSARTAATPRQHVLEGAMPRLAADPTFTKSSPGGREGRSLERPRRGPTSPDESGDALAPGSPGAPAPPPGAAPGAGGGPEATPPAVDPPGVIDSILPGEGGEEPPAPPELPGLPELPDLPELPELPAVPGL